MIENTAISLLPIAQHHYQEWIKSAVSPQIIDLNVKTIYDSRELDSILNRNTKRKWKHSDPLVPAWCVSGVDPLTDEPTYQGVQVKPDNPPINDNGKIQKYLGAKDFEAAPLFLNTGVEKYWLHLMKDVQKPIILTEGAKKAGSLLSADMPCISIPGVSTCRRKGRLHQNLALFAKPGRNFYFCFDNDLLTKESVRTALIGLGRELAAIAAKIWVINLPEGEAKGADDFISTYGAEKFRELITSAATFEEWLEEIKEQKDDEEIELKSRLAKTFNIMKTKWGDSLRFNTLKKRVELDGKEIKAEEVRLITALEFDLDVSTADAHTIVKTLAYRASYSPVVEYLDECESKYPNIDINFLDNLPLEYFGTDNPIHGKYFKNFLVSAVARARKPGEKVDQVFMLVSPKQGKYKSTFFRILFGDDFFSDQLGGDVSDKDEKMKMHRFWCLEWSEFESVYKRKDIATLKNFITSVEDTFRTPYDREPETYPRPCVFVGTSNEQEILHDPTGDRRFWIVPVTVDKIPITKVLNDKDKIWACANKLYKSGWAWQLSDTEEVEREQLNKEFQGSDFWDEIIEQLFTELQPTRWISTEAIVKRLGFESARQVDAVSQSRIGKVMLRLGFERKVQRVNGSQKRGWEKVTEDFKSFGSNPQNGVPGVISLHSNSSSRYAPITPAATDVTPQEQKQSDSLVTPFTPGVTEMYRSEPLIDKDVTPVAPVTSDFAETSEQKDNEYKEDGRSHKKSDRLNSPSTADKSPGDWKPNTGKLALYGGDIVKIVGFSDGGKNFQIEFPSGKFLYVKASALKEPKKNS